jgi:hypothetical protein
MMAFPFPYIISSPRRAPVPVNGYDSSDSALSELSKLENLDFGTDLDDESEFIG